MSKFIDQLKRFPSDHNPIPQNIPVWAYFNVISNSLGADHPIVLDCEKFNFDLRFEKNNDSEDYLTEGKIKIYLSEPNKEDEDDHWNRFLGYHYEIRLDLNDLMTGYCQCSPDNEDFNYEYKCCGKGCDWYSPCVRFNKIERLGYKDFDGYGCDLWKLEKEWKDVKEEAKDSKLFAYLKYLEDQIVVWENARDKFIKENNIKSCDFVGKRENENYENH